MSSRYRNLVKVLESWPCDVDKVGRDYGEHLRRTLLIRYNQGKAGIINEWDQFDRNLAALQRLSNNAYSRRYPRARTTAATGLTVEKLRLTTATESLKAMNEWKKNRGMLARMRSIFTSKKADEKQNLSTEANNP